MFSKTSLLFAGLLVGAAALPTGYASANSLGSAGGINGRSATAVHTVADSAAAQKQKAAALKKKKSGDIVTLLVYRLTDDPSRRAQQVVRIKVP